MHKPIKLIVAVHGLKLEIGEKHEYPISSFQFLISNFQFQRSINAYVILYTAIEKDI